MAPTAGMKRIASEIARPIFSTSTPSLDSGDRACSMTATRAAVLVVRVTRGCGEDERGEAQDEQQPDRGVGQEQLRDEEDDEDQDGRAQLREHLLCRDRCESVKREHDEESGAGQPKALDREEQGAEGQQREQFPAGAEAGGSALVPGR